MLRVGRERGYQAPHVVSTNGVGDRKEGKQEIGGGEPPCSLARVEV